MAPMASRCTGRFRDDRGLPAPGARVLLKAGWWQPPQERVLGAHIVGGSTPQRIHPDTAIASAWAPPRRFARMGCRTPPSPEEFR